MEANICHRPHPLTLGVGSKGQHSTFSEHGLVAYQIKGNEECSNMQAHIMSLHTPSTLGWGQRSNIFFLSESSYVAYHIKRELDIEYHAIAYYILTHSLHIPSTTEVGVKGRKIFFFLKIVMLHIK